MFYLPFAFEIICSHRAGRPLPQQSRPEMMTSSSIGEEMFALDVNVFQDWIELTSMP